MKHACTGVNLGFDSQCQGRFANIPLGPCLYGGHCFCDAHWLEFVKKVSPDEDENVIRLERSWLNVYEKPYSPKMRRKIENDTSVLS